MSALIRSASPLAASAVRPVELGGPVALRAQPVSQEALEIAALRGELGDLRRNLAGRDGDIEVLRSEVGQAFENGQAQGRQAAMSEFERDREQALRAIEGGVDRAHQAFTQALAACDRLAAALAMEALDKLVGERSECRRDMLRDTIAAAVAELHAGALLEVLVSDADFPDPDEIGELRDRIGRRDVEIRTVAGFRAGDCELKLVLGGLDVGINRQWGALSVALSRMAEPSAS